MLRLLKKNIVCLVCLVVISGNLYCQNLADIVKQEEVPQTIYWMNYAQDSLGAHDSLSTLTFLDHIDSLGNEYPITRVNALLLRSVYYDLILTARSGQSDSLAQKAVQVAAKTGYPLLKMRGLISLSYHYYIHGNEEQSFEYLIEAHHLADKYVNDIRYHDCMGDILTDIGRSYCIYGFHDETLSVLNEAIRYKFNNLVTGIFCYYSLGYSYKKVNSNNNPVPYYIKALDYATQAKDTMRIAECSFQIANYYFEQKEYEKAYPYLIVASEYGRGYSNPAPPLLELAAINIQKGHLRAAMIQLNTAVVKLKNVSLDRFDGRKYYVFYMSDFYENMARVKRSQGDLAAALVYQDSFQVWKDSFLVYDKVNVLKEIQFRYKMENKKTELRLLEAKKSKQIILRNAIILMLILLIIIAIQVILKIRYRQLQEKKLYEVNNLNAQQELNTYIEHLKQKNEMLDQFTQEIDQLKLMHEYYEPAHAISEQKNDTIIKLQRCTILTEDDWVKFKEMFDTVYPHFFMVFKNKYPNITQSEARLIALIKLNLSAKEIAGALGISIESVWQTRWRLKRKMGLSRNEGLEDLILSL